MNAKHLKLMVEMLTEVRDGKWKITSQPKAVKASGNPIGKFDLNNWVVVNRSYASQECGFVACAVGHAILDKRFNTLGLTYDKTDAGTRLSPYFDAFGGWDAVCEFFEFEEDMIAVLLFDDDKYSRHLTENENPKNLLNQIIRRIEFLLANGEEKFKNKFAWCPHKKLLSPKLKIYSVR